MQSNIQKEIDRESGLQKDQDCKQKQIDEMYTIRMELNKKSEILEKRDHQVEQLTKQINQTDNVEFF